jgi:Spy/CpxP family protein refolding chaperone
MIIQWKQVIAALAIGLILGAAAGTLGTHWTSRKGGPPGHRMVERLDKKLHFTPEQRERAEAIFQAMHPRLREIHESMNQELMAILTPEQKAVFEAIQEKRRQRDERKR